MHVRTVGAKRRQNRGAAMNYRMKLCVQYSPHFFLDRYDIMYQASCIIVVDGVQVAVTTIILTSPHRPMLTKL